jgi:hypothetical protein
MARHKPIKVEIVDEANQRFIVRTFADGKQKRDVLVKLPPKKRSPKHSYWHWNLGSSVKK